MRVRAWTTVAAFGGAGLLGVVQASAADAAPRVQVSATSFVLADGAAVAIPLRVSCDRGTVPNVGIEISQRSGRMVAKANGGENGFVCDGTPHDVQVFVHAQQFAFSRGTAFVTASVFSCNIGFPPIPLPFPGSSTTGCSARSSRTTRLVPGEIRENGLL